MKDIAFSDITGEFAESFKVFSQEGAWDTGTGM